MQITDALLLILALAPGYISAKIARMSGGKKIGDLEFSIRCIVFSVIVFALLFSWYTFFINHDAQLLTFLDELATNQTHLAYSFLVVVLLAVLVGFGSNTVSKTVGMLAGYSDQEVWQEYAKVAARGSIIQVLTKDGKEYYGELDMIGYEQNELALKSPYLIDAKRMKIPYGERVYLPKSNIAAVFILASNRQTKKKLRFRSPIYFD